VFVLRFDLDFEMQSSVELREEIATLEVEIMHLERSLLSLYRTAFEGHVTSFSNTPGPYLQYKIESSPLVLSNQLHHKMGQHVCRGGSIHHDKMSPAHGWASSDNQSCAANLKPTSSRVTCLPSLTYIWLMEPFFHIGLHFFTNL
jgi:hypothetical protein